MSLASKTTDSSATCSPRVHLLFVWKYKISKTKGNLLRLYMLTDNYTIVLNLTQKQIFITHLWQTLHFAELDSISQPEKIEKKNTHTQS